VPEGPYSFQGVFIPPFAHAPHVAFATDGTLLVRRSSLSGRALVQSTQE
jgi:hypothetical protein